MPHKLQRPRQPPPRAFLAGPAADAGRWDAQGRADFSLGSKPVPKHRSWSTGAKALVEVARALTALAGWSPEERRSASGRAATANTSPEGGLRGTGSPA